MKKILSILLILIVLFSSFSVAATEIDENFNIDNYYTYANRNAMSVYKVSYHRINEVWG